MTVKHTYILIALVTGLALLLGACGSSASNESAIATGVALTVQARDTQHAQFTPTDSPATITPLSLSSATPFSTKAPPTAPATGSGNIKACYGAEFIADISIPDGTILAPGTTFMKRWSVKNTGSCTWNSTYKFVFIDGDIMGGAYVYSFPAVAAPGQTVEIPVQLYAPQENGTYSGNWMIQAPDKTLIGVGQYNVPLSVSVKIVAGAGTPANNKTPTIYDVTNVVYHITRRCTTANTFWHITADITSNGPVEVTFNWLQSDGNGDRNKHVSFASATTITVDDGEWSQRFTSSHNARWIQIITTSPTYHEWPRSEPFYLCGD